MEILKEYKKPKQFLIEIKEYQSESDWDKTIYDCKIWCWSNMDLQQNLHNAKYNIHDYCTTTNANACKVFYTELKEAKEYKL